MNPNSRIFDKIRIGKRSRTAEAPVREPPRCDFPECSKPGPHRAPKGRASEGQYWNYCMDHVRQYNQSFNYFIGMADDAVLSYQKESLIGHRPTWKMGANTARLRTGKSAFTNPAEMQDPFGMFTGDPSAKKTAPEPEVQPRVGPLAQRAFDILSIENTTKPDAIKARYKALVKQLHPDANGGDRSLEDRLREIINAYNTLKAGGFA